MITGDVKAQAVVERYESTAGGSTPGVSDEVLAVPVQLGESGRTEEKAG